VIGKCGCCRTLASADVHLIDGVAHSRKPGDAHAAVNRYKKVSDAEFKRWVARCRKLFPLSKPVRATLENPGEDLIGICWDAGESLVLKVCPRLDRHHAAETLLHEWAHLFRGEEDPDGLDLHDGTYWMKFGELYRAWHRTT
jgi:hypothetical protein